MLEKNGLKTAGLRGRLLAVKNRLGPEGGWSLAARHTLGQAIQAAFDQETDHGKDRYGAGVAKNLGAILTLSPPLIDQLRRFAGLLSSEQVVQLSKLRLPDGSPISWSHVRQALATDTGRQALKWVKRAATDGWTSTRLGEEIHKGRGHSRSHAGRRPASPQSLLDLIVQIRQVYGELVKRNDAVWSQPGCSLTDLAAKLDPHQVSEELIESLEELRGPLTLAITRSTDRQRELDGVIASLLRRKYPAGGYRAAV
jgi:hypothetical protein